MRKIYTRKGDRGQTGLSGGIRVSKDSVKIECNGSIDEANSTIGLLRVKLGSGHEWQAQLHQIQKDLMEIMGFIARADYSIEINPSEEVKFGANSQEAWMNELEMKIKSPSDFFLLPGGNEVSALCHIARTQIRRAERRLVSVINEEPIEECITSYINRLSDLFFILSRSEMDRNNVNEEIWRSFRKKAK
ncbi:cob(I)yrinic acid a,c-diamide adenosyltransferase [Labilibaculum sp. K2S]|uniref:cob(I)yrinic acid a,c-diamide adenosyltransferase n=1 Tax=Labilibaculum sp. K2S TaxID=3056386 RepID=UPI0025A3AFD4|nr:cob(I)yrinic acid a,c-diamide adenosyltransferase [Labilibaculum sp. K2S]MDM8161324.1 cob(I)yrinic acid a,c-diamide adenosyltransferase [Labilibaculum sp. K2S]